MTFTVLFAVAVAAANQPGPQKRRIQLDWPDAPTQLTVTSEIDGLVAYEFRHRLLAHATLPGTLPNPELCSWRGEIQVQADTPTNIPIVFPPLCVRNGRSSAFLDFSARIDAAGSEFVVSHGSAIWWTADGTTSWGIDPGFSLPPHVKSRMRANFDTGMPTPDQREWNSLRSALTRARTAEEVAAAEEALRLFYAQETRSVAPVERSSSEPW